MPKTTAILLAALLPGCTLIDDPTTNDGMTDSGGSSGGPDQCPIYAFSLAVKRFPYVDTAEDEAGNPTGTLAYCNLTFGGTHGFGFPGGYVDILGAAVRTDGEESWAAIGRDTWVCEPGQPAPTSMDYQDFIVQVMDGEHGYRWRCYDVLTQEYSCISGDALTLCDEFFSFPLEDDLLATSGSASMIESWYWGDADVCPASPGTELTCAPPASNPFANPLQVASCTKNPCVYKASIMEHPDAWQQMEDDGFRAVFDPDEIVVGIKVDIPSGTSTAAVFGSLGLQDGDIITHVDGVQVTHVGVLALAWLRLRMIPGATVDVDVYRFCGSRFCDPTFSFTLRRVV